MLVTRNRQKGIEDTYSRKNKRKLVREVVEASDLKDVSRSISKAIITYLTKPYYASKNKRVAHLRSTVPVQEIVNELLLNILSETGQRPIQSIAASIGTLFEFPDVMDNVKTASEILAVSKDAGLYNIILAKNSKTGSILIEPCLQVDDETLQKIASMKFLPPMLCEPEVINNNSQGGYLTYDESVILGANNHHEEYQAIDVLNILAKIPLSLDRATLELEEKPKKDIDTPEKMTNFLRMIVSSRRVYRDLINYGNCFYLNWRFDKRGRVYSQGHEVNIQSTSYKKALINLTKREVIK